MKEKTTLKNTSYIEFGKAKHMNKIFQIFLECKLSQVCMLHQFVMHTTDI